MKIKRYFLSISLFLLTSCGFSLNYLVEGNRYNSPNFKENFYSHWDNELKNAKQGLNIDLGKDTDENHDFILKFSDLFKIDPSTLDKYENIDGYGADYKMNLVDNMFNYGYQSKLFDGQCVCGAQNGHPELAYQLARVQTDKNGFSVRFEKESDELTYFATQFKATTDNTAECYKVGSDELAMNDREQFHNSKINLTISLYTKNETNEIVNNSFTSEINIDQNRTNNGSSYFFYAFSLEEYNLSRLVGISVTYDFDDELINWNKTKGVDIDYSLMLYEFFFPYTSWN